MGTPERLNLYFELAENVELPSVKGRYFVMHDKPAFERMPERYFRIAMHSIRIWAETGTSVKYIKNRIYSRDHVPVDMDEFFWIKLRAATI